MLHLLKMSDADLAEWVHSQSPAVLKHTLETIDSEIRRARPTAGQPRSQTSATNVELARLALRMARIHGNEELLAEGWRLLAFTLNADEQHEAALPFYALAIPALERVGQYELAARTRIGYLSALARSGKYQEALDVAQTAETWFRKTNDEISLAKVYHNIGTVYNRLYQPHDAYRYHVMASETLNRLGDQQALAQSYMRLGNTLSNMDRYDESDRMYEKAEEICNHLGLNELASQAAYNRAFLYYQRGLYSKALKGFNDLRSRFEQSGSQMHCALCDMDESEIYLQLNLSKDAEVLARRAVARFEALKQNYEIARSKAFLGVALMQQGRFTDAHQVFQSSQAHFEDEKNVYWAAVVELYRAEVHNALKRFWEARSLAAHAKQRFSQIGVPAKTILSLVLLGRISLELRDIATAESCISEVLQRTADTNLPLLLFPFHLLRADVAERKGHWLDAESFYESAARDLEVHQSQLHHDDLRVTFFKGRNRAYEELVWLKLQRAEAQSIADAYAWCERSKSRGLIELLAQHLPSVQPQSDQPLLRKINTLREELNGLYVRSQPVAREIPGATGDVIVNKENELARTLREVSVTDPEYASLQQVTTATLESIQGLLPEDATLLEYFTVRDEVLAFVVTRTNMLVRRHLSPVSRINDIYHRLGFQLEKFLLGPQFVQDHSEQIFRATQHHLHELYQYLVAGIADELKTPRLIVVPHGTLHLLPFHAFFDGTQSLMDRFEISSAPSASVLKYCIEKPDLDDAPPLLIGVPDENAPHVADEIHAIAEVIPQAIVRIGPEATREAFATLAGRASFVHIATHAVFRQDNPMFSGFKLHDGWVTAFDLFSMTCQTNLVTLSSCKSGMSQVAGSDDLLGLSRGFLYAGARSLMVSLWNIDDESTAELMSGFYDGWRLGRSRSAALTEAMKAMREKRPNPFYWAPFSLIGKA